jgi:hypothetical protein
MPEANSVDRADSSTTLRNASDTDMALLLFDPATCTAIDVSFSHK